MAITYTWDCRTVDTYPTHSDAQDPANSENDVVWNIHYRLTGSETKSGVYYSESVIGTTPISVEDLSSFTPFSSLTNEIITGWATASLESDHSGSVAALKANISSSIVEQRKPSSVTKTIE